MMIKVKVQSLEKENKHLTAKQIEYIKDGKQLHKEIQNLEEKNKLLTEKLTEFNSEKQLITVCKSEKELGNKVTKVKQLHHLGNGRHGETHVAIFDKRNCTVKILYNKLLDQGQPITKLIADFKKNCAICYELHNPNLAMFIDIAEAENKPVLITELMEMNLFTYIEDNVSLDIQQQLLLCLGMSNGLKALHDKLLVHGNLHDHNVLIQGNQAKISDFCYPLLNLNVGYSSDLDRILPFIAPEIVKNQSSPSFSTDIFSLGVLALQVVTGTTPMDQDLKKILANVSNDHVLLQLINQCLRKESETRLSITKVCKDVKRAQESSIKKVRNLTVCM